MSADGRIKPGRFLRPGFYTPKESRKTTRSGRHFAYTERPVPGLNSWDGAAQAVRSKIKNGFLIQVKSVVTTSLVIIRKICYHI